MDLYLHGMIEDHHVHLRILSFASFSRIMEAERRTNKSLKKISTSNETV